MPLPAGFTLEEEKPKKTGLPAGFTMIEPQEAELADYPGLSVAEPVATFVSGAIAEPVAGLVGLASLPFGADQATENIESVRNALTYAPKSKGGIENLQNIAGALGPVGKALQSVEQGAGDIAYEATGSPLAGAIGTATPAGVISAVGAAPIRRIASMGKLKTTKRAKDLLRKAAPKIEDLKAEAGSIYKKIDDSGAVIKSVKTDKMAGEMVDMLYKQGYDPALHPKVEVFIERLEEISGIDQPVGRVDTLRRVANAAASSMDASERRLGGKLLGAIDDTLDDLKQNDFLNGVSNVGPLFKDARQLWQRAKKGEIIEEAFTKARNQASGFENGVRVQFRSILNNPKKRRSFTPKELKNMETVVHGSKKQNLAKMLGKFGFGEGQASRVLMPSVGIGAGAAAGGPLGAIMVPLIGQVSGNLAKKLTKGNAEFADAVVRAGKDGVKLTNEYIKRVPKNKRSVEELSELLMRPGISLKKIEAIPMPKQEKVFLNQALAYIEAAPAVKNQESE